MTTHAGPPSAVPAELGRPHLDALDALAELAAAAVVAEVTGECWTPPAPLDPALGEPRAAFVTLRVEGRLRGCVGGLSASRALADEVVERAGAAASRDPRFAPVRAAELHELEVEVTVIGEQRTLAVGGHAELLAVLEPGVHGVIVEAPGRRATLLPSVWEQLPDPVEFCAVLWEKAGLRSGAWPPGIEVRVYTATSSERRGVLSPRSG